MPARVETGDEKLAGNNSCLMLEDSAAENDIEIDSDTDDDDEEIMYSDVESDELEPVDEDEEILDIDALDADDPQLCAHYVREIYSYLTQMERKYRISPSFLEKKVI